MKHLAITSPGNVLIALETQLDGIAKNVNLDILGTLLCLIADVSNNTQLLVFYLVIIILVFH